jgi:phosphoribosylglycinamide formyltransferase 1
MQKVRIAVLIGGGGRLPAIYNATQKPTSLVEISLVVSFKRHSNGLDFAESQGLKAEYCRWVDYKKQGYSREHFDGLLVDLLKGHDIDLVVLAGWGLLVTPVFLSAFEERIINVHPALLTDTFETEVSLIDGRKIPVFRGNQAVEMALEAKVDTTGCTVHFVTEQMDTGKIILKKEVPILTGDTPESLYGRIHAAEDEILPEAIELIAAELLRHSPGT